MNSALNLTPQEIRDLTGAIRHSTQYRNLIQMGFNPIQRPDGSIVLSHDNYRLITNGISNKRKSGNQEPDFSSVVG